MRRWYSAFVQSLALLQHKLHLKNHRRKRRELDLDANGTLLWVMDNTDLSVDFARSPIFFSIGIEDLFDRRSILQPDKIGRDIIGGKIMHAEEVAASSFAQITDRTIVVIGKIDPFKSSVIEIELPKRL